MVITDFGIARRRWSPTAAPPRTLGILDRHPGLHGARAGRGRAVEQELGRFRFAWAGTLAPGQAHYFRVHGPVTLIEHDNTQNNANHIHSVWRDLTADFGNDALADHYRRERHR